ncbi:rhodanese-like domain-containing protein [Yeosuana marina]|uniref:rhodanese-like domain-containing protein n=1 Tax=Yeosuana marina TaxID=1565536 RepID=UPI0030EC3F2D|tara:strand:+ start:2506 stop:3123 length:618 start_codon:yes stop_codon:yes gene_type:complete
MKELEKVKRISIASTLFILAVLIGVLTFERPKNMYAINTKDTLKKLTTNNDYIVSLNDINNPDVALIDVRSAYEYDKGHLKNAINISTPEILNDENQSIFNELKSTNKTVVLYGSSPEEANIPYLLLYQLGYDNIKLLAVTNKYSQNKLITNESNIEKYNADIKSFIDESIKNVNGNLDAKETKIIPKKIITIKKKKKKAAEGGC